MHLSTVLCALCESHFDTPIRGSILRLLYTVGLYHYFNKVPEHIN